MGIPYAEVIGDPVAHSKSPLIHKFWLEALKLDCDFIRTRVATAELAAFLEERRWDPLWRGCSVTIPHKEAILQFIDSTDGTVQKIGAVNRVIRDDGPEPRLTGANTDWSGFLEPLRPLLVVGHRLRLAYVIGSGGAALAVSYALDQAGFTIVSVARNRAKAMAIQNRLGFFDESMAIELDGLAEPGGVEWGDRTGVLDLLVNATPLGMTAFPDLPLNLDRLPKDMIVYDLVYEPLQTTLVRRAQARGMRTIDGLGMLIGQAAQAFESFFFRPAPRQYDAELRELLSR